MRKLSCLLLSLLAVSASGFAPSTASGPSSSSLKAFEGKPFDIANNPLARGGKNSWEFELDTMYVEEPVATKKKTVAAKKATSKAAVKPVSQWNATPKKMGTKSSAYASFGQNLFKAAKKEAPAPAKKASPFSFFGKK